MQQELTLVKIIKNTDSGVLIQINEKQLLAQIDPSIGTLVEGSSFLCIVKYQGSKIVIKRADKTNLNGDINLNIIS